MLCLSIPSFSTPCPIPDLLKSLCPHPTARPKAVQAIPAACYTHKIDAVVQCRQGQLDIATLLGEVAIEGTNIRLFLTNEQQEKVQILPVSV